MSCGYGGSPLILLGIYGKLWIGAGRIHLLAESPLMRVRAALEHERDVGLGANGGGISVECGAPGLARRSFILALVPRDVRPGTVVVMEIRKDQNGNQD